MSRYGRARGKPTIEGRRAVLEALRAGREVERILMYANAQLGPQLREIVFLADQAGIQVEAITRQNLDRTAATKKHQGVVAVVPDRRYAQLEDIILSADHRSEKTLIVILDGIQDPHNLGAIARTVDAAGAHGMVIPQRKAVGITPGAIRASAGALEHVQVAQVSNIAKTIRYLKTMNVRTVGLDADASADYTSADYTTPVALVAGSEERGMSQTVRSACDSLISIPLLGQVHSLNASVAAAIVLYEAARQRRTLNLPSAPLAQTCLTSAPIP